MMDRRHFLKLAALAPALSPALALAQGSNQAPPGPGRVLILVELRGGNDNLNTLVPYIDTEYYNKRPTLAIPAKKVSHLNEEVGLHPSLEPLLYGWDNKDLAVVQGVGSLSPSLSHRQAYAAWLTGSVFPLPLTRGWIGDALHHLNEDKLLLHGATLGSQAPGPFQGGRQTALIDPQDFARADGQHKSARKHPNPALAHLIRTTQPRHERQSVLQAWVNKAPTPKTRFPNTNLGRQMKTAARVVLSRAPVAALHLVQTGYDTHQKQAKTHAALLRDLAESLAALRSEMIRQGTWDEVLVMTFSEFGRGLAENRAQGTEHGTVGPSFLLGGQVQGGQIHGTRPSLTNLRQSQLIPSIDLRALLASVARQWWGVSTGALASNTQLATLPLLRTG